MVNERIRRAIFDNEVSHRMVADCLGIRKETLSRKLAEPLDEEYEAKVMAAVEEAARQNKGA